MPEIFQTAEPVMLDGYQAVLKPSKYGYSLTALLPESMIPAMEDDRELSLKWAESKLKNPKRATLKPEPWEEVSEGMYRCKFSWPDDRKPPIVDSEGSHITDENTPLYGGSRCKLAFKQKPYILKDGVTYGTSLKLVGVQVISVGSDAGIDAGDLSADDVAALFGNTTGYKVGEPSVVSSDSAVTDDDF